MDRPQSVLVLATLLASGCFFAIEPECDEDTQRPCPEGFACSEGQCECVDALCPEGQACEDNRCVCQHDCLFGQRRCQGNMLQVCAPGPNDCRRWTDELDCSVEDIGCRASSSNAECVGCEDHTLVRTTVTISSPEDFPDVVGYSVIDGDLRIGLSEPGDLDQLICLREVTGDVDISGADDLDLSGLSALRTVGGSLLIRACNGDVAELPELTSIGVTLRFSSNPTITLLALDALASIGDDLLIANNRELEHLSLPSLTHLGDVFGIYNNPSYPSCEAEALLDQVGRYDRMISIYDNDEHGDCD